ncbi:TIR domain-containing protein [Brevundimonas sp. NPDC092305]|uniref:TIR domain-containing protein n=1 Tax=Brevundimonas sp. NPDC092305 TaxID=3363957 RepID=UPI0038001971
MTGLSAYVFISHASADNARLRPVVMALLEAGVPLWIDKPEDAGLDLAPVHFVGSISKADRWTSVVDQAIARSCAMLVFPSAAAARAREVRRETERGLAMMEQNPERYCVLPAFLDRADEAFDRALTGGVQGFNAWVEADGSGLYRIAPAAEGDVARLARYLSDRVRAADARSTAPLGGSPLPAEYHIPYLVDRFQQRDVAAASIRRHSSPILVVRGRPEDELGRFSSTTLVRRVLPEIAHAVCSAESLQILRVRWPTASLDDTQAFAEGLLSTLGERFQLDSRRLRLGGREDGVDERCRRLAASFAENGICRVVAARRTLAPGDKAGAAAAVRAWNDFWNTFPLDVANAASLTLLPVLEIVLDPAQACSTGWLERLKASLKKTPDPAAGSGLCIVPELGNVTTLCAREWVETDVLFADQPEGVRGRMADDFAGLFATDRAEGAMPMKAWATVASPILLNAGYV